MGERIGTDLEIQFALLDCDSPDSHSHCCHSNVRKLFDFWRFQVVFNWNYTKIGSLIIVDREMNIEQLENTFIIIFKWIAFIFFHIASCCKNVCVVCLNYSKSVVELLLSAIKKTDHVISPNQTVSYNPRFFRRWLLKVSWQKIVFEKPKSGDIKKASKNTACWEPKALWIKVLWQKVCLNKQSLEKKKNLQDDSLLGAWGLMNQNLVAKKSVWKKSKVWRRKKKDDSLLGASGLLLLVQPNTGGPPWRLHNDLPSIC